MVLDQRYLERHGGKFRVRVKVPRSARAIIGKGKLTVGLNTDSLIEANRQKWEHVARLKAFIQRAMKPGATLPPDPIVKSALALRKYDGPDKADILDHEIQELGYDLETMELEPQAAKFLNIATGAATPLNLLVEDWLNESKLAARTESKRRQSIAELHSWLRHVGLPETIEAIDKRSAATFKRDRFITPRVHPVTANSLLTGLRMYWRWLETNGHFHGDNPWMGLSLRKPRRSRLDRERPFTEAEITALFVGNPALQENRLRRPLLPIMAIASYTGAGREEIFSLQVRDYVTDLEAIQQLMVRMSIPGKAPDGVRVLYFPISKTSNRERLVPVHPEIVPILDSMADGKEPDDFMVFRIPRIKRKKGRSPVSATPKANAMGHDFRRYRQALGVHEQSPDTRRSKVNFHSFRRWFIDTAMHAFNRGERGFSPWSLADCVGHSKGEMPLAMTLDRYAGDSSIDARVACVASVQLPSVALDALRTELKE